MFEVELKFPLTGIDGVPSHDAMVRQIEQLDAERGAPVCQRDFYFAHPQRDFAQTDEALRIRCVGDQNRITYKGPIVDAQVKTRREIEIAFTAGRAAFEQLCEMLQILGFRSVRVVEKTRIPFRISWEDRELELALDDVNGLGTFLEIETLAAEPDRDASRDCILRFSRQLGLENSERKSYLCLLLESGDHVVTE